LIDVDFLEQICEECHGSGKLTNKAWEKYFLINNNLANESMTYKKPEEPIFYLCKKCSGRGRVLTNEGSKLIKFLRNWLNPNY
jgi:hypothetical protein